MTLNNIFTILQIIFPYSSVTSKNLCQNLITFLAVPLFTLVLDVNTCSNVYLTHDF